MKFSSPAIVHQDDRRFSCRRAISVFSDIILARILVTVGAILVISVIAIASVTAVKLFTPFSSPGWATTVVVGFIIIASQAIISAGMAALMLLGGRNHPAIVPALDGTRYITARLRIDRAM